MRFFLALISVFLIACEPTTEIEKPRMNKVVQVAEVANVKPDKVEKAPDQKLSEAFTTPGNLKNAPSQAETSPTGLSWVQLKEGDADSEFPNLNSVITVRFAGWTPDGKSFQKSKEGRPFKQRVGNLLKGWQEGVVKMKKGEIRRLWMPGKLAYDNDPNPNSQKGDLIFDIKLIEFKNKK